MRDSKSPKRNLLAGVKELDRVLAPHGFVFSLEASGKGSGGWFVSGCYRKGERRLELHFRYSLGLVTYHIGEDFLDHEAYMRFAGVYGQNQYPDFPKEPLDSFVHLAQDISRYCSEFLSGDGSQFHSWARQLTQNPGMFKGLGAIP